MRYRTKPCIRAMTQSSDFVGVLRRVLYKGFALKQGSHWGIAKQPSWGFDIAKAMNTQLESACRSNGQSSMSFPWHF